MDNTYNKLGMLPSSTLKVIACIFMAVDHVGLILFPKHEIFRIIGRLAFPIFAFFIAEGSRYSKHKLKRFLSILSIGLFFLIFYFFYDDQLYGNVFLTFSCSIFLDQLIYISKKEFFEKSFSFKWLGLLVISVVSLILLYILFDIMHFEYGFWGMLLPVFVNLTNFKDIQAPKRLVSFDCHVSKMILLTLGLLPLSITGNLGTMQFYSFLAVIPLFLYNGKVGYKKMKYVFYIFYPAHLLIIEGIAFLISVFNK